MRDSTVTHEILVGIDKTGFLFHAVDFHEVRCATIKDLRTCVSLHRFDAREICVCCNYFIKPRSTKHLEPTPDVALERIIDLCPCQLG